MCWGGDFFLTGNYRGMGGRTDVCLVIGWIFRGRGDVNMEGFDVLSTLKVYCYRKGSKGELS